jgi:hypothetical protein
MLDLLLESALWSLVLGIAVWLGLAPLPVRNPRAHMTAWTVVLVASLAMPVLMHRLTVNIPAAAPSLRAVESLSSILSGRLSEQAEIPALSAQVPLPPVAEPDAVQPPSQSGIQPRSVLVQPARMVAARPHGGARGNHQRRHGARKARRPAVLCRHSGRPCPSKGDGRCRNGAGLYAAQTG